MIVYNVLKRVETMAVNDKISKALKSAINHLEDSISTLKNKDENSFADAVWHVAAELEYALFLFSVTLQNEKDKSGWRINPKRKKYEVGQTLVTVQSLLNEAEKHMESKKLLDAYKKTYIARHHILKVQEDLAKKKREALKKKAGKAKK